MLVKPLLGVSEWSRILTLFWFTGAAAIGVALGSMGHHQCHHGQPLAAVSTENGYHGMVGDVLRMHDEDVRWCRLEALARSPSPGSVELRASVREDGSVADVAARMTAPVSSADEEAAHVLGGCMQAAVYSWSFPATGAAREHTFVVRGN